MEMVRVVLLCKTKVKKMCIYPKTSQNLPDYSSIKGEQLRIYVLQWNKSPGFWGFILQKMVNPAISV